MKQVVLTILAALVLASCGGSSGGTSAATVSVPDAPPIDIASSSRFQVLLSDAVTGQAITDPLDVTLSGSASLHTYDGTSVNGTTLSTTQGLVALTADFPASSSYFSVAVKDASNKGWISSGTRVTKPAVAGADTTVEIKMTNSGNAAAVNSSATAVAMSVQSGVAGADGSLGAPLALATPPKVATTDDGSTVSVGVAQATIQAGTKGTTADGTPAAAGPITAVAAYYSPNAASSLGAFPGGFSVDVKVPPNAPAAVLEGVAPTSGALVTAGFAQFAVTDSSGKSISRFDKPLRLAIDLPRDTADATLPPVGSDYPVWSFDEPSGQWVYETMGTVREKTPPDPGNLQVEFATTHLSTWALAKYKTTCNATIVLNGRPAGDARPLFVSVTGSGTQAYATTLYPVTDSRLTLERAPNVASSILVFDANVGAMRLVGQARNQSLCGAPITINIGLQPMPQYGKVQIDTSEACADGSRKRAVSTSTSVSGGQIGRAYYTATTPVDSTVASVTWDPITPGVRIVSAINPRTGHTESFDFDVKPNVVTQAVFIFTMPCTTRTVTGAAGL